MTRFLFVGLRNAAERIGATDHIPHYGGTLGRAKLVERLFLMEISPLAIASPAITIDELAEGRVARPVTVEDAVAMLRDVETGAVPGESLETAISVFVEKLVPSSSRLLSVGLVVDHILIHNGLTAFRKGRQWGLEGLDERSGPTPIREAVMEIVSATLDPVDTPATVRIDAFEPVTQTWQEAMRMAHEYLTNRSKYRPQLLPYLPAIVLGVAATLHYLIVAERPDDSVPDLLVDDRRADRFNRLALPVHYAYEAALVGVGEADLKRDMNRREKQCERARVRAAFLVEAIDTLLDSSRLPYRSDDTY